MHLDPYLTPYTKFNLKENKDLNVNPKPYNFYKKIYVKKLHDIGLDKDSWLRHQKHRQQKNNI